MKHTQLTRRAEKAEGRHPPKTKRGSPAPRGVRAPMADDAALFRPAERASLRVEKAEGLRPLIRGVRDRIQEFNRVAAWPAQSFQENTQC